MTTTRLLSLGSLRTLRAFASSHRVGHLAGSSWPTGDRDLDRVAGDLFAVAHADPERLTPAHPYASVPAPVDLDARRARTGGIPTPRAAAHHAQAS